MTSASFRESPDGAYRTMRISTTGREGVVLATGIEQAMTIIGHHSYKLVAVVPVYLTIFGQSPKRYEATDFDVVAVHRDYA